MPVVKLELDNALYAVKLAEAVRLEEKHEDALRKKGRASKQAGKEQVDAVDSLIRELKIEKNLEEQIESEKKRHHAEQMQRHQAEKAATDARIRANERFAASQREINSQIREFARGSELVSRNQQVYLAGGGAEGVGPLGGFAAAGMGRFRDAREAADNARRMAMFRYNTSQQAATEQIRQLQLQRSLTAHPLAGYGQMGLASLGTTPPLDAYRMAQLRNAVNTDRETAAMRRKQDATNMVASTADRATLSLGRMAMQVVGFGSATAGAAAIINTARQALDFAQQQRQTGADVIKSDFEIMREISEVSGPGQAKGRYAKYLDLKQKLGPQSAWGLLEKAIATGNEDSVDYFANRRGAMDPAIAMGVGSHLETLFKGQVNERQAASMMLEASRKSRWTVAQFAPSLPTAGVGGTIGGSSAAETLALQSVMSDVLSSPETASDAIRYAGVRGSQSPNLKSRGKGVLAMMMELHKMPFDSRHRTEFAGNRIEYNSFIDKVAENYDKIKQRQREIEQAQQRTGGNLDNLSVGHREFMGLPGARELMANQIAYGQEMEALRGGLGAGQLQTESTRRGIRTRSVRSREFAFSRGMEERGAGFGEWLGGTPESAIGGGIVGNIAGMGRFNPVNIFMQMLGLQSKTNEVLLRIEKNTSSQPAKPPPPPNGGGRR